VFIPLHLKLAVGSGLPEDSGYNPGNSGPEALFSLDQTSGGSGQQGPENPGQTGQTLKICSFEWCLWLTHVFLGSLEH
jgi:hypothetical protein